MRFYYLRIFCVLALTITVCTVRGLATGSPGIESTPAPLPPKPDFSSMQFLLGTWSCLDESSRRPSPSHRTATFSMDPTGFWLNEKSTSEKTSWFPYEGIGLDKITYDGDSHRWMDVYTGNFGDYALTWSKGWKDNTIVWNDAYFTPSSTGDVMSESPVTGTKVNDTKITYDSTFKDKSGRTIKYRSVCNKNS